MTLTKAHNRMIEGSEINVKDFGATGNGITDDTSAIQSAINVGVGNTVVVPKGTYAIGSTINLDSSQVVLRFEGATIKPIANNFTIFEAIVDAYGVKIIDLRVRGAGTTGVTVFDMYRWVVLNSGLIRADIRDVDTGVFLNGLCYGLYMDAPDIFNVNAGIIIKDCAGAVKIHHPMVDLNGNAGVGIDIYHTASGYANVGTQIIGGGVEGGTIGIRDASFNTQVIGTYFERNTEVDISLISGSHFFAGNMTSHTAAVGVVAIRGRSADAAKIYHPFMSSGARSTGLFDFDSSNTQCYYDVLQGNAFYNLPRGVTTGINDVNSTGSEIGNVSSATGVGTTIFTPSGAARGRYDVVALIANSGAPSQYAASATVIWDGSGARIISDDAANLTLTLSGNDVKITQTSGSTQTVYWAYDLTLI